MSAPTRHSRLLGHTGISSRVSPIVYGHHNNALLDDEQWPHPRVTRDRAFGIDTIRHGVLTATRFPERQGIQTRRFRQ